MKLDEKELEELRCTGKISSQIQINLLDTITARDEQIEKLQKELKVRIYKFCTDRRELQRKVRAANAEAKNYKAHNKKLNDIIDGLEKELAKHDS